METSIENYFNTADENSFMDKQDINLAYLYMKERIDFNNHFNILSLGAGLCSIEEKIATDYPSIEITCIDFIDYTRKIKKVKFIKMDLRELYAIFFNSKYDLIFSFSVLQYFSNNEIIRMNKELLKLLTEKGIIYHMDIPDKRKKYISRLNKIINDKKNILSICRKK